MVVSTLFSLPVDVLFGVVGEFMIEETWFAELLEFDVVTVVFMSDPKS